VERPSFAKDYPDDEELRALVDAFESGDYRSVRAGTTRIAASADANDAVRAAARDLRARTEPTRPQIALLVVAALLVLAISGWAIATHGLHAERHPSGPPPRPTVEHIR
jgi:hypothetical protein